MEGSVAAESGLVRVGDVLLAVNGGESGRRCASVPDCADFNFFRGLVKRWDFFFRASAPLTLLSF